MPRVLIVTYYFPPAGGPGVQRALGFVRHLPSFGWDPVILTVQDGTFFNRDERGLDLVPPTVPVYRARAIEPFGFYNRLRGRPVHEAVPVGHVGQTAAPGLLARIAGFVRANLFIPDARIGWVPFARRAAERIIRQGGIDAILTSSPPHSVHLIGRGVARRTKLPWVADFRDPWTKIYYNADLPRIGLARRVDEHLEQSCVRRATRIATVNELVRDSLGPEAAGATVVRNGYEEEDFRGEVAAIRDRFALVYVGNLIAQEDTSTLFRVLGEMAAADAGLREALRLVFVGRIHGGVRSELERHGLADRADFVGFVPHGEAIAWVRRATALLFVGVENLISAKIFEYAASGRPILALAPIGGDIDRLLRDVGAPGVIEHGDAAGIRERFAQLFRAWRQNGLSGRPPMTGAEQLSRRGQTERMAALLDEALAAHRALPEAPRRGYT